jgi:hypothetical protein
VAISAELNPGGTTVVVDEATAGVAYHVIIKYRIA